MHGTVLPVIHARLACQSVFDFMDYMNLDSETAYRNGIINTGLSLLIGLTASFSAWLFLLLASVLNIIMAKRQAQNT